MGKKRGGINLLTKLLHGIFIGISLVLPGMSGGTALIILGTYQRYVQDISELQIKKHIITAMGIAGGVVLCALIISELLELYPDLIVSFLMGMLLASIKIVFAPLNKSQLKLTYLLFTGIGIAIAWTIVGEPLAQVPASPTDSILPFFGGGILTSATMLLPGVSGSSLLIMLNLYDDLLLAVSNFVIWPTLIVFCIGLGLGILLFARIISTLYQQYKAPVSFLLSGLLLGSTKALIPGEFSAPVLLLFIAGFLVVYFLSGRNKSDTT